MPHDNAKTGMQGCASPAMGMAMSHTGGLSAAWTILLRVFVFGPLAFCHEGPNGFQQSLNEPVASSDDVQTTFPLMFGQFTFQFFP
jgi:hypothetical protein